MKTVVDWKQPWDTKKILEVAESILPEDLGCPFDGEVDKDRGEVVIGEASDLAKMLFALVHETKKMATSLVPIFLAEGGGKISKQEKMAVEEVFGPPATRSLSHLNDVVKMTEEMAWIEVKKAVFGTDDEKSGGLGIRKDWTIVQIPQWPRSILVGVVGVPR